MKNGTTRQLKTIGSAYDRTVENYKRGVRDADLLPLSFKNSTEFKRLQKKKYVCSSGAPDIKKYLNPRRGMKFLDVGSCANLINYRLDRWLSIYYGIDISSKLIRATKLFVRRNRIRVGGLVRAKVDQIPFADKFFDIAAIIGVLEYFDINYTKKALKELSRVLKSDAKMVVDTPNLKNPDAKTMIKLESYLGRPRLKLPARREFERELRKLFSIEKIDDHSLMIKYYVKNIEK